MRGSLTFQFLFSKYSRVIGGFGNAIKIGPNQAGRNHFSTSRVCCMPLTDADYPPNNSIKPTFVNNRNPKNLEKLRIGEKPAGYGLDKPNANFWNKVKLEISSKHISAQVVHYLGKIPAKASTKEWCIKKFVYSTNDASSAKVVGQVLAQRCLQAGIFEVACFFPEESRQKEKVKLFLAAMEDGGITLSEPIQVLPVYDIHDSQPVETPWEVHEDIDDKYTAAVKLRDFQTRKKKHPDPVYQDKYFRNQHHAQTKMLIDQED